MTSVRSSRKQRNGQSLVEFAVALPIIVLLIFGVIDLGRAVYTYNTLSEAARQASRLAIVDQDQSRVAAEAAAYAPAIALAAADVDVCFKSALTPERDCASPATDNCVPMRIGCLGIVTTNSTFQPFTPLINLIVSSIDLSSTSVAPIEYVCPTASKPNCP